MYMWPNVADSVCLSVGLSVMIVSPAKTAEPIEMPFWLWSRVGPRNHVLNMVQIPNGIWIWHLTPANPWVHVLVLGTSPTLLWV